MSRGRLKLPNWHDVKEWAKAPKLQPKEKVVCKSLEEGDLFEFLAVESSTEDYANDHQGPALAYQTKAAQATRQGAYFEGAHVAAIDAALDNYLRGDEGLGECMHVYHRCASWPCKSSGHGKANVVHCPRWRILTCEEAATLPYARDRVNALVASRSVEDDASSVESSEALALEGLLEPSGVALGDQSGTESDASGSAKRKLAKPSSDADIAWARHLEPRTSTSVRQLALDEKLAQELERANASAAKSGAKHGIDVPAGHQLVGKVGTPVGGIGIPAPLPQTPATPAAPARVPPGEPSLAGDVSRSDGDPGTPRASSSKGAVLATQLRKAAEDFSQKRSAPPPDDGASYKRRVVERFARSLLAGSSLDLGPVAGAGVGELGSLDEPAELEDASGAEAGLSQLFRLAPQPSAITSVPILAEQRPGEVMAVGLERIRRRLSALHGDALARDPTRPVMAFYHQVMFLPTLGIRPGTHAMREMETLVAALDGMIEGNVARVMDILFGRYTALTESLLPHGTWDVAREHEVLPQRAMGIASEEERQRALMIQARTQRFQQQLESVRNRDHG